MCLWNHEMRVVLGQVSLLDERFEVRSALSQALRPHDRHVELNEFVDGRRGLDHVWRGLLVGTVPESIKNGVVLILSFPLVLSNLVLEFPARMEEQDVG